MGGCNFDSLDDAFKQVISIILRSGESVAPRGVATREVRAVHVSIADPRRRYVSLEARRWSFPYALGEFCWHARGSNRLEEISFYASRWKQMSSDRETVEESCYGAKIFGAHKSNDNQWNVAKRLLVSDPDSRRAVLDFAGRLDEKRARGVDTSCATSLQFSVRNGSLEALASMRSNDAILGFPYDVFLFTMLQEMMAVELGLELGAYHHFVGSMHIYESDLAWAREIAKSEPLICEPMPRMSSTAGLNHLLDGEACTRNGLQLVVGAESSEAYWTDLLAVLRYRNAVHHDVHLILEDVILNSLFQRLAHLHGS